MKIKIWIETGGDTGAYDLYHDTDPNEIEVGHLDWDDWKAGEVEWDHLIKMKRNFGEVMPEYTAGILAKEIRAQLQI